MVINLSLIFCYVRPADNKMEIITLGAVDHLRVLVKSNNDRISQQVHQQSHGGFNFTKLNV